MNLRYQEAMIITSLLVFVKVLIEKQGAEAIHLPESFIKTSNPPRSNRL